MGCVYSMVLLGSFGFILTPGGHNRREVVKFVAGAASIKGGAKVGL